MSLHFGEGEPTAESEKPQTVDIEGPAELEPGENIFRQEPFSTALTGVAERSGQRIDKLYSMLRKRTRGVSASAVAPPFLYFIREDKANYREQGAYRALEQALAEYPYWQDYLHLQNPRCGSDGTVRAPKEAVQEPQHVPSYGLYARERQEREGTAVLIGLDEAFPQDLKGMSAREALEQLGGGQRTSHRHWRLVKASELVAPR